MPLPTQEIECDILVVGGGLGGCAATLRAARLGYRVCLTEENPWLGGQCTSQGRLGPRRASVHREQRGHLPLLRVPREHSRPLPEPVAALPQGRDGALLQSRRRLGEPPLFRAARPACPPSVGLLEPQVEAGRLRIYPNGHAIGARRDGSAIRSVTVAQPARQRRLRFRASYYLDATEPGDLLPMLGLPYASGAESRDQTGEPDARADGPDPGLVQTFTFPFAVDFRPGEDHTIPKPTGYEHNRDHQPYTLTLRYGERDLTYKIFEDVPDLPGSFWTYRRLVAGDQFAPGQVEGDLAMINWAGNDFKGGNIIDADPAQRADSAAEGEGAEPGAALLVADRGPPGRRQGPRLPRDAPAPRRHGNRRRAVPVPLHPRVPPHHRPAGPSSSRRCSPDCARAPGPSRWPTASASATTPWTSTACRATWPPPGRPCPSRSPSAPCCRPTPTTCCPPARTSASPT